MLKSGPRFEYAAAAEACSVTGDQRRWLHLLGVAQLRATEEGLLGFDTLFDFYENHYAEGSCICHAVPMLGVPTIILPGDSTFLKSTFVDQHSLLQFIEDRINENLADEKLAFFICSNKSTAFSIGKFSFRLVGALASAFGGQASCVVFDARGSLQIAIDEDLEFVMIASRQLSDGRNQLFGKERKFWNDLFNRNFVKYSIVHKEHADFINEHYVSRLPGIETQTL